MKNLTLMLLTAGSFLGAGAFASSDKEVIEEIRRLEELVSQLQAQIAQLKTRLSSSSSPQSADETEWAPPTSQEWAAGPMPEGIYQWVQNHPPRPSSKETPKVSPSFPSKKSEPNAYTQGHAKLRAHKVSEARQLFKSIPEASPDYPQALYWLGMIALFQDKNYKEASAFFSKAYQHTEKHPARSAPSLGALALFRLAESLFYQDELHKARIVISECRTLMKKIAPPPSLVEDVNALEERLLKSPH